MVFISVADAVERTGKGQTTIYRLCRKHEHTRHVKREDKKFLIDEELLLKHFPESGNSKATAAKEETAGTPSGNRYLSGAEETAGASAVPPRPDLVDLFIDELLNEKRYYRQLLDQKEEQLKNKDRIIDRLQERQKELYYLLNHQISLLENPPQQEPKQQPEPKEHTDSPAQPPQEAAVAEQQPIKKENSPAKKKVPTEAAAIPEVVYYVLAFVALLLTLAIVYVDELRALTQ